MYFFHPDHIGSSTFLTDEAGNPYQFLLYLPFGEGMAEQKAGGYSTKYRFTGKEVDEETGLYYFGARYYDPRISLWYGVDPLVEKNFEYTPYVYAGNNPIRYIDPDGQDWYEDECNPGKMQWFEGSGNREGFKNIGAFYEHKNKNGSITVFKQQEVFRQLGSMKDYDGSYLRPTTAYEYDSDGDKGKLSDDLKYLSNGETGDKLSRAKEIWDRDVNEPRNSKNVEDATIAISSLVRGLYGPIKTALGIRKGERNKTAKPSGTANPYKHLKPDPNNSGRVLTKDSNGKEKSIAKPEGFDDFWNGKKR